MKTPFSNKTIQKQPGELYEKMKIALLLLSITGFSTIKAWQEGHTTLAISVIMSVIASLMIFTTLPNLKETFINARLYGKDILKAGKPIM